MLPEKAPVVEVDAGEVARFIILPNLDLETQRRRPPDIVAHRGPIEHGFTRAHGDDQILGGAADETGVTPSDPDAYDERADPAFPGAVLA